jgi:hypothetical protein
MKNALRTWNALLVLTAVLLAGCTDWNNRDGNPYLKPGEKGTPADRTGGARSAITGARLHPTRAITKRSRSSKEMAHAAMGVS